MEKQQIAKYICGAASLSLSVIGFALGRLDYGILKEILTGVGLNVGGNLFQDKLNSLQRWISGEEGMLNHDIQKAWIRAAITASKTIETQYFDSHREQALPKSEEAAIRSFFEDLRAQLNERFTGGHKRIKLSSETLERLQADGCPEHLVAALRPIRRSFANETDLLDALKKRLAPDDFSMYQQQIVAHAVSITLPFTTDEVQLYLDGGRQQAGDTLSDRLNLPELLQDYPPEFTHFFEANFLPQIQFFFKEELKKDAPENNKAWRAFQMMLLYGLRDDIADLRADQQAQFEKLHEAIDNLERQPAEERSHEPYWDRVLAELSAFAEKFGAEFRNFAEQTTEKLNLFEVYLRLMNQNMGRIEGTLIRFEKRLSPVIPTDIADHVQRIWDEHTGVFVGRDADLEQIDAFIRQRRSGKLLITAPAGYGKTALLANWLRTPLQSEQNREPHIIRHAFRNHSSALNAYRHLLHQLHWYYNIDGPIPADPDGLRSAIYNSIKEHGVREGTLLIVVIDALDEAEKPFSPDFMPICDGLFIIVSARTGQENNFEDWRGWVEQAEHIKLDALSRADIRDWLRTVEQGSLAELAGDEMIASRLWEITKGLSLYLHYLIQDICKAHQQGQNLQRLLEQTPTGLVAYIKQQLDALQVLYASDAYLEFFTLLTITKGFVKKAEILGILQIKERAVFGRFLSEWRMTRWLAKASQDDLYDFTHPILGDLFLQALEAKEEGIKAEIEAKLLAWCAAWQEHKSHYALQYYPAHLRDIKQYEALFELARNADFRQAQQQVFPHVPDLPLRTLQLALEIAIEQNDVPKMAEFLLAHAQQIMTTIEQEIPLAPIFAEPVDVERAWELADMWQQYDSTRWLQWYLLIALAVHTYKHMPEKATETLERLRAKLVDVEINSQEAGEHNLNLNIYLLGHIHRIQQEYFFAFADSLEIEPEAFVNHGLSDAAFDLATYYLKKHTNIKDDERDEVFLSTFFEILNFKMLTESPTMLAAYNDLLKEELQRLSQENISEILQLTLSLMILSLRVYLSGTVATKKLWRRSIENYWSAKERWMLNKFFNGGIEKSILQEFSPSALSADELEEVCQVLGNLGRIIPKISNKTFQKEMLVFYAYFGSIFNQPERVNHAYRGALQFIQDEDSEQQQKEYSGAETDEPSELPIFTPINHEDMVNQNIRERVSEQLEIFYKIAHALLHVGEQHKAIELLELAYKPVDLLQLDAYNYGDTFYCEGIFHRLRMIGGALHKAHEHDKAREVVKVAYHLANRFLGHERKQGWGLWGLSEIVRLLHKIAEREHAKRLAERLYKLVSRAIEQHNLAKIFSTESLTSKFSEIIESFEWIGARQKIQDLSDLIKAQIQDKHLGSSEASSIIFYLTRRHIRDYSTAIQVVRNFIWHEDQDKELCNIIEQMVEYNIDEAIRTVQLIYGSQQKGKALYCIIKALINSDGMFQESMLNIYQAGDNAEKADALTEFQQSFTGKFHEIMNLIQQIEDHDYKWKALSSAAYAQAMLDDISGSIRTIQLADSHQEELLLGLMEIQIARNNPAGLAEIAQAMEEQDIRRQRLHKLAVEMKLVNSADKYIEDQNTLGQDLYKLAIKMGAPNLVKTIDVALKGVQFLTDPAEQAEALFTVAAVHAGLDNWQTAQLLFFSPALNQNLLSKVYVKDELAELRQNTCQAITELLHSSQEKQESRAQERILLDTYAGIKIMTGVREIIAGHTQIDMPGDELILIIEPVTHNTAHIDVNNILNQMPSFNSDVECETGSIEPPLITLVRIDHAITDIVAGSLFLSGDSIEEKIHMGPELERHLIVKRENKDVHEQAQENHDTTQLTAIHLCITALMQASDTKDWVTAYQTLEQAVEIADPIELCIIALLYNRSGNVNRAKAIFRQALKKFHGVKCTGGMPFLTRFPRRFDALDIAYFLCLAGEIEWAGEIVNDTFSNEDWHCEGRFDTWEDIRSVDFEAQWYELSNNNDKAFGLLRRALVIQRLWGRAEDSVFDMLDRLFVMYDQLSQEGYYLDEKNIIVLEFQRILLLLHTGFPEQALQKMQPIFNVLLDYMEEIIGRKGSLFSFATSFTQSWLPFSIIDALLRQKGTRYVKELLLACAYYPRIAYNMCERLAKAYPEQAAAIAEVLLKHEPLDKKSEV